MKSLIFLTLSILAAFVGVFIKTDYKEYHSLGNILLVFSVVAFYYFIYFLIKKLKNKNVV